MIIYYHWPLGTVFLRFNARPASVCLFVCLFVCPRPATLHDSVAVWSFPKQYVQTTASDFHVPIIVWRPSGPFFDPFSNRDSSLTLSSRALVERVFRDHTCCCFRKFCSRWKLVLFERRCPELLQSIGCSLLERLRNGTFQESKTERTCERETQCVLEHNVNT
jgi:hypothetical protein